jgi:hypothetical protein
MATMDPTTLPPPDGLPASLPDGLPGSLLGTPPDGLRTALHLGALHPVEQVLVYLLAFGPFAVLALVVVVRRRQDRRDHPDLRQDETPAPPAPGGPQRDR